MAPEGAKRWRWHLATERNRALAERKKAHVKAENRCLECEACGLDFVKVYGDLGADFCEVHHRLPVSALDGPVCPCLEDLAILCSNCHRMIHRTKPLMTVEDFREVVKDLRALLATWSGARSCG